MRKIYPQMKSSPRWFNQTNEVKTHIVEFSNSNVQSLAIGVYTSPVITIGQDDNVNAWISKLYREIAGGSWRVDISTSAEFTGKIYIHVSEAN